MRLDFLLWIVYSAFPPRQNLPRIECESVHSTIQCTKFHAPWVLLPKEKTTHCCLYCVSLNMLYKIKKTAQQIFDFLNINQSHFMHCVTHTECSNRVLFIANPLWSYFVFLSASRNRFRFTSFSWIRQKKCIPLGEHKATLLLLKNDLQHIEKKSGFSWGSYHRARPRRITLCLN